MADMILYLVTAAIGFVIGTKLRTNQDKLFWTGTVQSFASCLVLFAMSARIGSNQEIIENLGSIGLYSFLFTIIVFATTIGSLYVLRRFMGLDKFANLKARGTGTKLAGSDSNAGSPEDTSGTKATGGLSEMAASDGNSFVLDRMTVLVLIFVFAGILFGHFLVSRIWSDYDSFTSVASMTIRICLCILLFLVGVDLSVEGTIAGNLKSLGLKMLLFPLISLVGTMIGSFVAYLFMPVTLKESLAIGAGLGWYSLAPAIIMDAGHITASAISFLHNVMREFFSILIIPFVAKYVGYIEAAGTPGAPSMDICLPVIERSSNSTVAVYGFINGVIMTILVPIIVPLIIS